MDATPSTGSGWQGIAANAARGFANGSLATLPMSAFMLAAQRLGFMGRQPPRKIGEAWLHAVGLGHAPSPAKKAFGAALHLAFGGAAGVLYALVARRRPRVGYAGATRPSRARAALTGMAFGSLVWAASYKGWVPALGIMPPPSRDRPGRPASMLAAHWIYGATLGARTASGRLRTR